MARKFITAVSKEKTRKVTCKNCKHSIEVWLKGCPFPLYDCGVQDLKFYPNGEYGCDKAEKYVG